MNSNIHLLRAVVGVVAVLIFIGGLISVGIALDMHAGATFATLLGSGAVTVGYLLACEAAR